MANLNKRTLDVFKHIVDAFFETGSPIGSKTIAEKLENPVSSATIRNTMARLEELGFLYSPHTSAGRLPTEQGLQFFVNGFLERDNISRHDQERIDEVCAQKGADTKQVMMEASALLSGLSSCASLVIAPKLNQRVKHIEFIQIDYTQALAVLVMDDGQVENRLLRLPPGMPPSILTQAGNYLNTRLANLTLEEALIRTKKDLELHRHELHEMAYDIIDQGLASWSKTGDEEALIVHGQSHLLDRVETVQDLDKIKHMFSLLETKQNLVSLLEASKEGDGIQILIGADNPLFEMSGCSLVLSPFENSKGHVIGALGVIGPTRINYGRIIPMVDYTSKVVSRLLD